MPTCTLASGLPQAIILHCNESFSKNIAYLQPSFIFHWNYDRFFNLTVPALTLLLPFLIPEFTAGVKLCPADAPTHCSGLRCLRFPACVSQSPFSSGSSSAPVGRQGWGSGTGSTSQSHLKSLLLELVLETKPLFWQCLRFWCVCTLLNHLCSTSHPNWHLPSWSPTAAAFVTAHTTSSCWYSPLLVVFVKVTFCGQTFLPVLCQCPQFGAQTPLSWPVSSGVSFLWKGNNDQNSGIISWI